MVYGSTEAIHTNLRLYKDGKLKFSSGELLPIDENGDFYAGDVRAT